MAPTHLTHPVTDLPLPCLHPPPILFLCAADCSAIHKGTVIASSSSSGGGHVTISLDHAGLRYFADTDKASCRQGNMLLTVNTTCGGTPPPAPPPTTKRLILVDWKVQVYGTITAYLGDSLLFNWRLFSGLMEIPSRKQSQIPSARYNVVTAILSSVGWGMPLLSSVGWGMPLSSVGWDMPLNNKYGL